MFDFRYHALSLTAVFLALGIGIVLGSTLGDTVVSEADRDVRASLRRDVVEARTAAREASAAAERRDRVLEAAFPRMAGDRLDGLRVAVVSNGALPDELESSIRATVDDAGGTVDSVSELDASPDLRELGGELGGRFRSIDDEEVEPLGRRIGRALVEGGALVRRLEDAFPDRLGGDYDGADAVVYYRDPEADRGEADRALEEGIVEGLAGTGLAVVGVEASDTEPSQVGAYQDRGLSTVDSVDTPGGRIALALALAGAEGSFGIKDTAEDPLPPPPGEDGG